MALLRHMTVINSDILTLEQRSAVAEALVRLSREGDMAAAATVPLLSHVGPQLTAAASSGRHGSMEAARHVPAFLQLLADYHCSIAEQSKDSVSAASQLLINRVASRLCPDLLSSTLYDPILI